MDPRPESQETTRRPPHQPPAVERPARLMLTIACHPQLRRVGERVELAMGITPVSRIDPEFRTPEGRPVGPLTDNYLSRTPVVFARHREVVVVSSLKRANAWLEGELLVGPVSVDEERLRRGVAVTLAGRVTLMLQLEAGGEEVVPKFGLVGESAALQHVREDIALTAALPIPVLVRGESGTGKELVARAIHAASPRASRPYVSINMAALNPQTAVAELFGHARGSFTGAFLAREGYFREADGGTIFLDEIGEATIEVQAMLLRVLETGEIQPIGGVGARRVDVRVIAATDAHLEEAVEAGAFRLSLFHRLAGFVLAVPPLRQRRDDIPRLVVHFLAQELRRAGHGDRFEALAADASAQFGPSLIGRLLREPWPGNVRQLSNAVRQMVAALLAGRAVDGVPAFAAAAAAGSAAAGAPARVVGDLSNDALVAAMQRHGWNVHATARALGMSRTALYARMDRCPSIRKAVDVAEDELRAAYARHDGDLVAVAAELQVSLRGLQMRVRQMNRP